MCVSLIVAVFAAQSVDGRRSQLCGSTGQHRRRCEPFSPGFFSLLIFSLTYLSLFRFQARCRKTQLNLGLVFMFILCCCWGNDWVKKCMEYEVEGSRPRGRPKRTWWEVVREDCQARKLNKEDAMDHCKWRKVIKEVR